MQHQQMIKASDDASSVQNSNTVRHKGKASSGRKVIWYFPRSLLEFIYKICGGCVFPHFENWVLNQLFICYSEKFANSWRAGDKNYGNCSRLLGIIFRVFLWIEHKYNNWMSYCSLIRASNNNKKAVVTKPIPAVQRKIAKQINWTRHSLMRTARWTKRTMRLNGRGFKRSWTSKIDRRDPVRL